MQPQCLPGAQLVLWYLGVPYFLSDFGGPEKWFYLPVPVSGTLCGLAPPLSVTDTAAARLPVAVGLKVTLTVQLALAEIPPPQVLVWTKSAAFVPVMAIPVIVRATPEALWRVDR